MNIIYNSLLRVLDIIFPLITFPYVSRVLSPEGIGKVDFSNSIIQYFILVAQLGIPFYGIRECAKYREDKDKLTKCVQEIFIINIIMIVISYTLFFIMIYNVERIIDYRKILILISISILTTSMGMEWFFQAIEEYKYITIRNIIVKIFALILMFKLVKKPEDYIIYGVITILSVALGHIYNFIYATKNICLFKKFDNYNFKKHLKPILFLFAISLANSIYINLDKIMLGILSGDKAVGLYTTANKIIRIIIAFVTSLGAVMLPRMSYYIENNKHEEVNSLIKKCIDFILMISLPATVGIIILAKSIIFIFSGEDYLDAVITMQIISPIIIALGLSNLIGVQILISYGKEKLTLISTIIGAVINIILNIILIPLFSQNGSAIAMLITEISVTIIQLICGYKYIKGNIDYRNIKVYLIGSLGVYFICNICINLQNEIVAILESIGISILFYFILLYYFKVELITNIIKKVKFKIINNKTYK